MPASRSFLLPRRAAALVSGLALAGSLAAGALAGAAPALADNVMPHDPIGGVWSATAATDGVELSGWAADPDALTTNVTVTGYVDGRATAASAPTSIRRPRVARAHHTGPTPGFALDVPVPPSGRHTVCLVARGIGQGMDGVLDCVETPLGTTLSSGQLAAHSPQGAILRSRILNGKFRVSGWATDPDDIHRRSVVVLYIDGAPARTVDTQAFVAPRPSGAGKHSAFYAAARVGTGSHVGCVWVVNVGFGSNAFLGCTELDTRGPASTAPVTTPRLNRRVLREAKRHIGQPYVWGATGPSRFDCSGLVMYSYHKFGFATPRIAADQFTAARLIPASRAVRGDLVFYHDSVGQVYHVGIYSGPGMSVAAIDPAEGVNWQPLSETDTWLSFGSFTHT